MKVLLINVVCKNGSTGKIAYDLYTRIRADGDEAAVCYGRGKAIKEPNILKFGIDAETLFHALMTRITGFTGCFSFFSTLRLMHFIKEYKPDVVHIHELHAYFVNIKPLLQYLKDNHIRTIMTLHCEFAYTGKCGHSVECEQWMTGCKNCPRLHEYVSTLFFDNTRYMFEQKRALLEDFPELIIVAPSAWLSRRAGKSFLKNHPVYTIHNGIDTDIFHNTNAGALRSKYHISDDEKVILALAPDLMSELKGGEWVEKIAERMKSEKTVFIFIGVDNAQEHREENKLIFPRIYDAELLAQFYSLADVFLICSKRENFPTTCIEAQCCGTSVCGFDTGGTKETILYQPEDSCAPYGDIDTLELILRRRLMQTPEKNMIESMAFSEYSADNMYQKYKKLYSGF